MSTSAWTAHCIEAAASIKSFRKRDENDESKGHGQRQSGDFRGEKLSNVTHESPTHREARPMKKGAGKGRRSWCSWRMR